MNYIIKNKRGIECAWNEERQRISRMIKELIKTIVETTPQWKYKEMEFVSWELAEYETGRDATMKKIILKGCKGKPGKKEEEALKKLHPEINKDLTIFLKKGPKDVISRKFLEGQLLTMLEEDNIDMGSLGSYNIVITDKTLDTNPELWSPCNTYERSARDYWAREEAEDGVWDWTQKHEEAVCMPQKAFREMYGGADAEPITKEEQEESVRQEIKFSGWYGVTPYKAKSEKLWRVELAKQHLHSGGQTIQWRQDRYDEHDRERFF